MTGSSSPLVSRRSFVSWNFSSNLVANSILIPGNYQDGGLALWSALDYSLLCATSLSHPLHTHHWDPYTAYEFTTVGAGQEGGGVSFWMLEEDMGGKKCQLKVSEGWRVMKGDVTHCHCYVLFRSMSPKFLLI